MKAISKKYTNSEICAKIKRYKVLKNKISELEKQIDEIGTELKEVASENGGKFILRQYTVSVSQFIRNTISYAEFAKEHPRLAKKFVRETNSVRLNVK